MTEPRKKVIFLTVTEPKRKGYILFFPSMNQKGRVKFFFYRRLLEEQEVHELPLTGYNQREAEQGLGM